MTSLYQFRVTGVDGFARSSSVRPFDETYEVEAEHPVMPFNRRVVFTARSEDYARGRSVEAARAIVREHAATRCDLLNRLDEIAREAQGAVA